MKKLFLLLILSICTNRVISQTTIPDFKSNVHYINSIDTLLRQNIKQYDLIIAFRAFSNLTVGTEYHLMILYKNQWQKAVYKDVEKGDRNDPTLTIKPSDNGQCEAFYQKLVASHLFTIEDDKVNPVCTERDTVVNGVKRTYSFGINDGQKLEMWVIAHAKSRHLYYYAPDFYIRYCPPYQDRRDAINIMKLFSANW